VSRRSSRTTRAPAAGDAPPRGSPRPWERVHPAAAAAALAGIHLVVVLALLSPAPHPGGDNAAYLALARSLLEDGGYRELWDPAGAPHTQYPPLWPLLLAGGLAAGIQPWTGFQVLAAVFSAGAVGFAYLWARRDSTPAIAAAVGVLLALGPGVVDIGRVELSDAPFWAFCMLALWGLSPPAGPGTVEGAPPPRAGGRSRVVAGAAGVLLAYASRAAGLPLVLAAGAWAAATRRWGTGALLAGLVLPFGVGWGLRTAALGAPGYGGFLRHLDPYRPELGTAGAADLLVRIGDNVVRYAGDHLPFLLVGAAPPLLARLVGTTVLALAAAGWWLRVRGRAPGLAGTWLPLYLGLVALWPAGWSAPRFLLPVLPVLLVLAAEAILHASRASPAPGRTARLAAGAALVLVVPAAVAALVSDRARLAECRAATPPLACLAPGTADFLILARDARGRLPAGAAVIARKPTLWWAESGYPARVFPYSAEPDSLLAAAAAAGARYVVIDRVDAVASLHLVPAVVQRPQAFCVMLTLGPDRATLLGIVPGADTLPDLRERPGDEEVEIGFPPCAAEFWAGGTAPR
jgi:hypothetical protein